MFPSSLLNKIYVSKSLKNTPGGFEFTLKNVVDSGTLAGIKALNVDGADLPLAAISLRTAAGEKRAEEISSRSPVPLRYSAEAAVCVAGEPLPAGSHQIRLVISVFEAGQLTITISDEAG